MAQSFVTLVARLLTIAGDETTAAIERATQEQDAPTASAVSPCVLLLDR